MIHGCCFLGLVPLCVFLTLSGLSFPLSNEMYCTLRTADKKRPGQKFPTNLLKLVLRLTRRGLVAPIIKCDSKESVYYWQPSKRTVLGRISRNRKTISADIIPTNLYGDKDYVFPIFVDTSKLRDYQGNQ